KTSRMKTTSISGVREIAARRRGGRVILKALAEVSLACGMETKPCRLWVTGQDLMARPAEVQGEDLGYQAFHFLSLAFDPALQPVMRGDDRDGHEIGRASCRVRRCVAVGDGG